MTRGNTGEDPALGAGAPANRRLREAVAALVLALVLGAAGCSDDMDDGDEGAEPSEPGTEIVPGEGGPVD